MVTSEELRKGLETKMYRFVDKVTRTRKPSIAWTCWKAIEEDKNYEEKVALLDVGYNRGIKGLSKSVNIKGLLCVGNTLKRQLVNDYEKGVDDLLKIIDKEIHELIPTVTYHIFHH